MNTNIQTIDTANQVSNKINVLRDVLITVLEKRITLQYVPEFKNRVRD